MLLCPCECARAGRQRFADARNIVVPDGAHLDSEPTIVTLSKDCTRQTLELAFIAGRRREIGLANMHVGHERACFCEPLTPALSLTIHMQRADIEIHP